MDMTNVEMLKALQKAGILTSSTSLYPALGHMMKMARRIDKKAKKKFKRERIERLSKTFSRTPGTSVEADLTSVTAVNQPKTLIDLVKAFRDLFGERAKNKLFRAANKGAKRYKTQSNDLVALRTMANRTSFKLVWREMQRYFDKALRLQQEVNVTRFFKHFEKARPRV